MKKNSWLIGLAAVVVLIAAYLIIINFAHKPNDLSQATAETGKLRIAASINPIADMAAQIGGQFVKVDVILPPGASPHTFEPTPQQIRNMQGVALVFAIGHGLDDWIQPIVDNASGATVLAVDKDIKMRELPLNQRDEDEPDQTVDPHYWLTPANAKTISQNITDALSQADPAHKDAYASNLASYQKQLDDLDAYIKNKLSGITSREMITHHNAWGYFADAYGLQIVGTFEISPGREPTPQQIADLHSKAKEFNVKTIFSEPQLSDASLRPFVQDLSLNVKILDPVGTNMGYIDMMRYNADTISKALR
ncbi:MAG: metal ABC transporter substrate-binding protein [Patescibacteria group bacterium]|nr:metal ABC transporter substrate-binding protein [Patescibacteria group bacterium]